MSENLSQRATSNVPLFSLHQQVLEIQQSLFLDTGVDKGSSDTCLSATTGTTNLMHVVFDFFGHCVDDDVLI